jgi:CheY-like chemotaxis protein
MEGLSGRKVLIVDDDRATLFAVRSALAPLGYRFYEAMDGAQALSALRQHRPDLILMDVRYAGS